tara:strand:- start:15640 stop:16434 length:795 start_codon:yes stop_codon:yes gene_type:complete
MNNFLFSMDFGKRVLSSCFLIFIALISLFTNQYILTITLILLIAILTYEWICITENIDNKLLFATKILINIIIFLLSIMSIVWSLSFYLVITFLHFFSKKYPKISTIYIYLGPLYLCFPLIFLYSMYLYSDKGIELVVWCLLVVWFTDTFAYLGGNIFQGKKLVPSISPKKTWSGFLSGLIGGVIISLFTFIYYNQNIYYAIIFGLLASLFAQFGDLLESYIKRIHSIKNSGNLIPGHGGMLDRLDSLLTCSCLVYISYNLVFK